jgi:hypothetical protein
MPWCPRCREEFREGFDRCTDCDVALVRELKGKPPPVDLQTAPGVWFWTEGLELAEKIYRSLEAYAVPCLAPERAADGRFRLFVATDHAETGRLLLYTLYELDTESLDEGVLFRDPEPPKEDEAIRDHPVLHVPLRDLKLRAALVTPDLLRCAQSGTQWARERAIWLLVQMGPEGHQAWLDHLLSFAEQGATFDAHYLNAFERTDARGKLEPGAAWIEKLRGLFRSDRTDVRGAAAGLAGWLQLPAFVPELITLLRDPELGGIADDALYEITGERLDFEPELPEVERERIIAARQAWWAKDQN